MSRNQFDVGAESRQRATKNPSPANARRVSAGTRDISSLDDYALINKSQAAKFMNVPRHKIAEWDVWIVPDGLVEQRTTKHALRAYVARQMKERGIL